MKYIFIIVATVVLTLGAIMNAHFVIHDDGYMVKLVQKEKMTFDDTYVDARDLNPVKWLTLPKAVRKALNNDKSKKLKKDINEGLDKVNQKIKKIFK
ncbi:MAG: hypothetical protein OEZ04_06885 [Nitrospinota bacterium]|nr:hypothetical protein [Nitrospinota bacterium]